MKNDTIAVIGASGKTGSRVLERLTKLGYRTRGLSRHSRPSFDWHQPDHWQSALEGVRAIYVTYQPDLAIPKAEKDIKQLLDTAIKAGIEHIVLLSGRGEDGARNAEQQLIQSGLSWNVVRAAWFMQNFSESFMLDGVLARNLVLPEPKATEPFVDVDDIADVAVAALTRAELRNQLFEVTGPDLLSFESCVAELSDAIGEHIAFTPVPVNEYLNAGREQGMPEDLIWLMNELFTQVLDGRNEHTTTTIKQLTGREARSFSDYVVKTNSTGAWKKTSVHVGGAA